jgi:flagellar hook capping protein FlgD
MKKIFMLAFVVLMLFVAVVHANERQIILNKGAVNIMEIVKEHRARIEAGEISVSTVIWERDLVEINVQVEAIIRTSRNGDNWEYDFTTSATSSFTNSSVGFYFDHSFPDAPYNDYGTLDDYEQNCDGSEIYWWGDEIYDSNGDEMDADYPLVSAWREGVYNGGEYSLTTEIDLDYDFQDYFDIQWRFTATNNGEIYQLEPSFGNGDGIDQQGWPVHILTYDLRPNLMISQIELRHDDGSVVTSYNPAVEGEDLDIKVWVTEDEGFWAGDDNDIKVKYYKDNSNFDYDYTNEIDAYETDYEDSDDFSFSSAGQHSFKVMIDTNGNVNETNEGDNEQTVTVNVVEAPSPPTVTISDIIKNDWNDVTIYWSGSDPNGGTLLYRYKLDSSSWSNWGSSTQKSYNNLSSGNHTFYVEVKDPDDLTGSDNEGFNIHNAVNISSISNQNVNYGETLSFIVSVSGGSGNYNYSTNYGTIDNNGNYSWTPAYNPNPYDVMITVQCQEFSSNYDTEGFQVLIILPDVVISGLESSYELFENETLSEPGITASGGDGTNYGWVLHSHTTGGNWLGLTTYSGVSTGLNGVLPFVNEDASYDYTLDCTSLTNTASFDFTVTVNDLEVIVSAEHEEINVIIGNEIEDFTVTASGLGNGQYVWGLGSPPTSNNGNTSWYGLTIPAGVYDDSIIVSGTVNNNLDLPIYVAKYDAWQIQGVDNVIINAYPQVSFSYQSSYLFYQNQAAQIQFNATGGDGVNYIWSSSDTLLTIDSINGSSVWFNVDTSSSGTYQVDVTCAQEDFIENQQVTQINITIEGLDWDVSPTSLYFPAERDTLSLVISNITINGQPFSYYLTLDNSSYYDILSPMSGYLTSGESDTIMISNYENTNPYELSALLTVHFGGGGDVVIVDLSTSPGDVSLFSCSLPGNDPTEQPLVIWNITELEQVIDLNNFNDLFTISEDQLILAAGDFATVYISADETEIDEYDILSITSEGMDREIPLRKLSASENSISYDDGIADSLYVSTEYLLNYFVIEEDQVLSGIEAYFPQNYQQFYWVIFDGNFNQLYEIEDISEYTGWQQFALSEDDYLESGEYYLGISGLEENEVVIGFDVGEVDSSYEWNGETLTNLEGILFIRAMTMQNTNVGDDNILPATVLMQNCPNPFNPTTDISFSLAESANVNLEIYNSKGQKVKTLFNGYLNYGNHRILWNGKNENNQNVASGVYFYKMNTNGYIATKKMILLK